MGRLMTGRVSTTEFFSKKYPTRFDGPPIEPTLARMSPKPGARLLFIGDSVTDCGRLRPVGRGSRGALGSGYVAEVDRLLSAHFAERPVHITNMGVGGNTVRDLERRWDDDVLELDPDWLSIFIGINDVWRRFDAVDRAAAVPPEEFEATYERLIQRSLPRLKGLVLMTPFFVQKDRRDPMRRAMDVHGEVVRALARRHGALLVDTQAVVDRLLRQTSFASIAPDRVHPTPAGHAALAEAFVKALRIIRRSRR